MADADDILISLNTASGNIIEFRIVDGRAYLTIKPFDGVGAGTELTETERARLVLALS